MINVAKIFIEIILLLLSSLGISVLLFGKKKLHQHLLFGFTIFLGISQLISMFIIYIQISTSLMFIVYFILIIVSLYGLLGSSSKILVNKVDLLILIGYVFMMIYISSLRTVGIRSFDSAFYMSLVNNNAFSETFGMYDYMSGIKLEDFFVLYDFQSFYYLNSFFLRFFSFFSKTYNVNIYIWSMSIIYFILNFSLALFINDIIVGKNIYKKILIILICCGFIGGLYWNNSLAFYGNTFRTLFVTLIVTVIYEMLQNRNFSFRNFFLLSCAVSAAIASSSSSLFILFVLLYVFILMLLRYKIKHLMYKILLLMYPYLIYLLIFNSVSYIIDNSIMISFVSVLVIYVVVYENVLNKKMKNIFNKVLIIFFNIIIPVLIIITSIYLIVNNQNQLDFFARNSFKDMVWDYFYLFDFSHFVFNILLFVSFIYYLYKNVKKDRFSGLLILLILIFINPLSYAFVEVYLASEVAYRYFEVLFNGFTISFFMITWLDLNKSMKYGLILIFVVLSCIQLNSYYADEFIPGEDYNSINKAENDKIEVVNYLNEIIENGDDENIVVISQIEEIQAYMSQIHTPISYHDYRGYDRYALSESPSDLVNIFIVREYSEQQIFYDKPKYEMACSLAIENETDFVIIRKDQYYEDDKGYHPLHFEIRNCADNIFENNTYIIYRFYW